MALIANMSATFTPLPPYLVVFSIAALLLWLRIALTNREENWRIRRVNENLDVPAQIMRSGMTFVAGSIALAWILTTVAVAAPLTSVWSNLDGIWSDVRTGLEGAFGGLAGTDSRIQGTSFGSSFRVHGELVQLRQPGMTVGSSRGYYMRTVTYDIYTGHGWSSSEGNDRRVAAGTGSSPATRPTPDRRVRRRDRDGRDAARHGTQRFHSGLPAKLFAPLVVHQPGGLPLLGALQSGVVLSGGEGLPDHRGDHECHRGDAGRRWDGLPARDRGDLPRAPTA